MTPLLRQYISSVWFTYSLCTFNMTRYQITQTNKQILLKVSEDSSSNESIEGPFISRILYRKRGFESLLTLLLARLQPGYSRRKKRGIIRRERLATYYYWPKN